MRLLFFFISWTEQYIDVLNVKFIFPVEQDISLVFLSDEGPMLETLDLYYPYWQYTDLSIFRFASHSFALLTRESL